MQPCFHFALQHNFAIHKERWRVVWHALPIDDSILHSFYKCVASELLHQPFCIMLLGVQVFSRDNSWLQRWLLPALKLKSVCVCVCVSVRVSCTHMCSVISVDALVYTRCTSPRSAYVNSTQGNTWTHSTDRRVCVRLCVCACVCVCVCAPTLPPLLITGSS